MKKLEAKKRQERLLEKVPAGAKKVSVLTAEGDQKYKTFDQIADTDEIQINKQGEPIVMLGSPGRAKKATLGPANKIVAEIIRNKQKFIETDSILIKARENPESPDVLQEVILGLTEEAASIGFERGERERKGEETSQTSVRRINALKAIADTWLKRKDQISTKGVDLESPGFKAILKYILETFHGVLDEEGVHPTQVSSVFTRLSKVLSDEAWEAEAKTRIKKIV